MEEILAGSVAATLKDLLGVVTSEIASAAWGVDDDMKKLQNTIEIIIPKLADAEEKQLALSIKKEKDDALTHWLKMLKEVAYDAVDIMDNFSYGTIQHQLHENSSKRDEPFGTSSKMRHFSSFYSGNQVSSDINMSGKLEDISKRLDVLLMNMSKLQLQTTSHNYYRSSERSWKTLSLIDGEKIIGREADKNELMIKMFTRVSASSSSASFRSKTKSSSASPNSNHDKTSVISIVGPGGIGKTALAQLVYNDELVQEHFDKTIWVCVSKDSGLRTIWEKVLEAITQKKFSSFEVLVKQAQKLLSAEKYLLVLDDLGSEDAVDQDWGILKNILKDVAQGSTILITTCEIEAANRVNGSIPLHKLKQLTDAECWSIIAKRAFSHGGAAETPAMTGIGEEIAHKCCGLPLAAKSLGALMHSRSQQSDWLSIKNHDSSNSMSDIMTILKLSYDHFPLHLKMCFTYCSIFPKGYEFHRETLVQLWMAEGFIPDELDKRSKEDIADEYFGSLLSSSFFEGTKRHEVGDIKSCKMHDLVHDLAQAVVGDQECASYKVSDLTEYVSDIRRLRLTLDRELLPTFSLHGSKKLRTVLILEPIESLGIQSFESNDQLRVLHLVGGPGANLSELSEWIGKLKLLRYLNLTSFNLSEVKNHKSIHDLYYLETLVLSRSEHIQNLLHCVGSLGNLRNLDISYTDIQELPDSVSSLCNLQRLDLNHCYKLITFPKSVSSLTDLKYLDISFTPIEELPVRFYISLHGSSNNTIIT